MTIKVIDAAFETTITTGTGTYTLQGAQAGHQSFAAAGNGSKVFYQVNDGDANGNITAREVGVGTVTIAGSVTTLSRDAILYSTNSNSPVSWSGTNPKNVLGSIPALGLVTRDENLNFVEGFGTGSGTANAQTVTLSVAPRAYSNGMKFYYYATVANTGVMTINVNGLGAKAVKINGADPAAGMIAVGSLVECTYNSNVIEIVTSVMKGLAATAVQPAALMFTKSYTSSAQTITSAGTLTLAHGMGIEPKLVQAYLECTVADQGYSVGDKVFINPHVQDDGGVASRGAAVIFDATNLNVRFGVSPGAFVVLHKTTGAAAILTNTAWKYYLRAWA